MIEVTPEMVERAAKMVCAKILNASIETVEHEWSEYPQPMKANWMEWGSAVLNYALTPP